MHRISLAAILALALAGIGPAALASDGESHWKRPSGGLVAPKRPKSAKADSRMVALVSRAAANAGVPQAIAHAVIRHESGYRPHVTGAAGEYGLGQIKCGTARLIGFKDRCRRLYDASVNLAWSMRYLDMALDRGGATCAGISLYNRGIWAKRLRCTAYGRIVMANAKRR